jgi:hypothetical protein
MCRLAVAAAVCLGAAVAGPAAAPNRTRSTPRSTWPRSAPTIFEGAASTADEWMHEGRAYFGSWGFIAFVSDCKARFCPSPEKSALPAHGRGRGAAPTPSCRARREG